MDVKHYWQQLKHLKQTVLVCRSLRWHNQIVYCRVLTSNMLMLQRLVCILVTIDLWTFHLFLADRNILATQAYNAFFAFFR